MMKVKFQQSGGYAGLIRGCEVAPDFLLSDEADALKSLVKKSNIKGSQKLRTRGARDLINYVITIETNDEVHTISFDDMSVPENVQDLLGFLKGRAKPQEPA